MVSFAAERMRRDARILKSVMPTPVLPRPQSARQPDVASRSRLEPDRARWNRPEGSIRL
jgi:hypothetical protein